MCIATLVYPDERDSDLWQRAFTGSYLVSPVPRIIILFGSPNFALTPSLMSGGEYTLNPRTLISHTQMKSDDRRASR